MDFLKNLGKKKYTYGEIYEIISPIISHCPLKGVHLNAPEIVRGKEIWRTIVITYCPGDGFTMADYQDMEALRNFFPVGQCYVFGVFDKDLQQRHFNGVPIIPQV